jgi:hypothetical protein
MICLIIIIYFILEEEDITGKLLFFKFTFVFTSQQLTISQHRHSQQNISVTN